MSPAIKATPPMSQVKTTTLLAEASKTDAAVTKLREDRVRRQLIRKGYRLSKNAARSKVRLQYGPGYEVHLYENIVFGCGGRRWMATLDQVEDFAEDARIEVWP